MSEGKRFADCKDDPYLTTKLRGPVPLGVSPAAEKDKPPEQTPSSKNETNQDRRKREIARMQKDITDVCENLELGLAKDVADLAAIGELCGLLKELGIQSGLQLGNDIQQGILNFTCLVKLLEEYRYAGCNIPVCFKIINCLLEVSYKTLACTMSQAELLKELGYSFLAQSHYDKSIETAEQLAKITKVLGDHKLEAEAYLILLKSYIFKGSLEGAQCSMDKYVECSAMSGDELCKGYAAMGTSYVFTLSQKYEDALKKAEEFLEIARSLQNRRVECEAVVLLAAIHTSLFNIQKSLDFYSKGLEIAQELQRTNVIRQIKLNQASVHSLMGKYQQSYEIGKQLASEQHEDKAFSYTVLCNLSVDALILNHDEESLKLARDSLAIAETLGATEPLALSYGNIGLAQEKMKDYSGAIESYKKCLEYGKQMGDNRIINNSYCNLGRAHEGKGDKKTAREYYKTALATPQPPSSHWCDTADFRFSADYLLAKMAVDERNWSEARTYLEPVVERCDSFRKSVNDSPLKICFNDTQKKPYQYLQYVLLEEEAKDKALFVGEKGRGRDFYDKFVGAEGEHSTYLETPQDLLNVSNEKNEAVLFLSQLEVVNKICGWFITPDGKIADVFVLPTDRWEQALTSLCCVMYDLQNNPEYKQKAIEVRGIKVKDDNIETLPETAEEFHSTEKLVEGFSQSQSNVLCCPPEPTMVGSDTTNHAPNPPSLDCTRGPDTSSKAQKDSLVAFTKVIVDLSELVVRPIEHHLKKLVEESTELLKPKLLIIPQGKSFNIPYAALQLKDGKPLCSQVSLHEAFSFHSYLHCIKLDQESQMQANDSKKILIIGNPTNDLPFAKEEAEAIANQLGVPDESCMIGPHATRALVVDRLPHATLIHFACHGTNDGRDLLLAPEENQMSNTESHLTIEDISRLTMRAKLVVLSACHTARGKINSEGVLGLARSFLIAGAKSVLTALWAIPDEATKAFMEKFYKNLGNMPVCDALSTTMCEMREEESFKDIIQWGSFKVLGANIRVLDC